jgi:hypothetical protein
MWSSLVLCQDTWNTALGNMRHVQVIRQNFVSSAMANSCCWRDFFYCFGVWHPPMLQLLEPWVQFLPVLADWHWLYYVGLQELICNCTWISSIFLSASALLLHCLFSCTDFLVHHFLVSLDARFCRHRWIRVFAGKYFLILHEVLFCMYLNNTNSLISQICHWL